MTSTNGVKALKTLISVLSVMDVDVACQIVAVYLQHSAECKPKPI